MCLDKKVVAGAAIAAVAISLLAPGRIGAALPLLVVAVCPLSMLVMMKAMSRRDDKGPTESGSGTGVDEELARLRREVAQLRAEDAGRAGPTAGQPQERR